MSGLDVEALLESAAAKSATSGSRAGSTAPSYADDIHRSERQERRSRDRDYDYSRDPDRRRRPRSHSREGRSERDADGADYSSYHDSRSSRRRSRSRDSDRRSSYRSERRRRGYSRSRSPPDDDRHYRPSGRSRRDRERDRHGRRPRASSISSRRSRTPQPTEDERDRRTIFVQQLAVRLRTKELIEFFEKVGPVKEAQIVKDRVSNRSKGVGYVEFKNEESVPLALQLTGQKLLGIPIIAQLTEAEKNRQARTAAESQENTQRTTGPQLFHRLYVGNIHFSITESDLRSIFEPFGELEFVQLQKEESGRSKGYGFVQYTDPAAAKEALEKMNGFDLAGRQIRVGLGNDKGNHNAQRNNGHNHLGHHHPTNNHPPNTGSSQFDRISARESDMASGASALDDSDVVGVNFNNFSRDALMRKLARVEPSSNGISDVTATPPSTALPIEIPQASRCVVVKNLFDASEETEEGWEKDLENDVREECQNKYGDVVSVVVDPSTDGEVYIKFKTVQGGENAIKGLNGRYFGGRKLAAQPVVDAVFSLFARSKAI